MKKLKIIILLFFLFILFLLFSSASYSKTIFNSLSNNIFRLHVIANSDTIEDQNLKYKVRDALISYMNTLNENINTKEEAINIVNINKDNFNNIAKNVIKENGFNYNVDIEICNSFFPTKYYGDITLPAGYYDALKVKIGNAEGKNWWCVMFPSLCFIEPNNGIVPDESKENLEENLNEEDYNLISSDNVEFRIKFKLIELIENAKENIKYSQISSIF